MRIRSPDGLLNASIAATGPIGSSSTSPCDLGGDFDLAAKRLRETAHGVTNLTQKPVYPGDRVATGRKEVPR
jgi:hypothetical protein